MYYVLEEDKGLIGDLYVRQALRTAERENLLIAAALEAIMDCPGGDPHRIPAHDAAPRPRAPVPRPDCLTVFERNFMRIDLKNAALGKGNVRRPMYVEKWSDHYHDAAAQLIAAAYAGHIDSRINDQYRTQRGARRFLHNIVQYPGCGAFYRPASLAAFEGVSGRLVRHLAGQPGDAGDGPRDPDLRQPVRCAARGSGTNCCASR